MGPGGDRRHQRNELGEEELLGVLSLSRVLEDLIQPLESDRMSRTLSSNIAFPFDTAAIIAALSKMQSLMNTYIASPLRTINQYEQSTAKYQQEVMYLVLDAKRAP